MKNELMAEYKICSKYEQYFSRNLPESLINNIIEYLKLSVSMNTWHAYESDLFHYIEWGGQIPSSKEMLMRYLTEQAPHKNTRTLKRRLVTLRKVHHYLNVKDDPTSDPMVLDLLKGIERKHGVPKKKAAPITLHDLDKMIAYLDEQITKTKSLLAVRDKALILLGYYGAFRRSELVNLTWEKISFEDRGLMIYLDRSKGDQKGEGEVCPIPSGSRSRCPVLALLEWRQQSKQNEGYIFKRFNAHQQIIDNNITGHYANIIVKNLASEAGCERADEMSAHSLRRGCATEASRLGAPAAAIKKLGRWHHMPTVFEYIDAGRSFNDSAINFLLKDS